MNPIYISGDKITAAGFTRIVKLFPVEVGPEEEPQLRRYQPPASTGIVAVSARHYDHNPKNVLEVAGSRRREQFSCIPGLKVELVVVPEGFNQHDFAIHFIDSRYGMAL